MRGLVKATHYYSTQQARADWAQLAEYAKAHGYSADVAELEPHDTAGHKTIDRRINALMVRMGIDVPFWQWQAQQEGESVSDVIEPLGAAMRKQTEQNGSATHTLGTLVLRMTKDGHDWALELNDEKPINAETMQHWCVEVGAPGGTPVYKAYGGKVWRLEWRDDKEEEAAHRAETVAFYLNGGAR